MAKQEEQQTMEEYLLSQLDTPVVLKDGTMMTKPEAIADDQAGLSVPVNRESGVSPKGKLNNRNYGRRLHYPSISYGVG